MNNLLWAACWQMGIPESEVHTCLRTEIPDGGIDTRIMRGSTSDTTGHLQSPTVWQFKASDEATLTETSITSEVNKPFAKERIQAGDAYRLCVCAHVAEERRTVIEGYLATAVKAIFPDAPQPTLVSAGGVARMASHFPSFVQEFRGFELQKGTYTLEAWGANATALTKEFVPNAAFNSYRDQILQHVDPSQMPRDPVLPIVGLAGIGKTRAIYEALKTLKAANGLVLYIDNEKEASGIATLLANTQRSSAILVVDDCSPSTRFAITQALRGHRRRVRALTVQHESQGGRQVSPELQIERYSDTDIEKIMKANYPGVAPERMRAYVHLSEGYLRLAIDLCDHDSEIVQAEGLAPAEMTARMYYQERTGENTEYVSALALFTRVGREGDVAEELDSLCRWRGFTRADVERRFGELKDSPGFVQRSAVYYRVSPELIAMQAFDDAWKKWAEGREDRFLGEIQTLPEALQKSFLTRVSRGAQKEVRETVRNFFRSFAQRFGGDSLGCVDEVLRLRTLIEVDPDFYFPFLRAAIVRASDQELKGPERNRYGWEPRRQLVYIADELAQFRVHFKDAENILFRLASVENEPDLGNNATRTWQRLYRPQLSGTPLSFEERLAVLETRLPRADQPLCRLFRGALEGLFDFHGTRVLGSALVAGKIPEPEWRFTSQEEVNRFVEATLSLLLRVATEREEAIDRNIADGILLNAIDVFVRQGFLEEVNRIVPKEQMPATVAAELHSRFTLFLGRAEKFGLPPLLMHDNYNEKIVEWLDSFQPKDLVGRLIVEASNSSWDHYGKEAEWHARLAPIAEETLAAFRTDRASFDSVIAWLHSEKARGAFDFGLEVGRLDLKHELLDFAFEVAVETKRPDFARGILAGSLQASRDNAIAINAKLDVLQQTQPEVTFYLSHAIGDAGEVFERTLQMVSAERLSPLYLRNFTVWVGDRRIKPGEVRAAVDVILPYVRSGFRGSADVAIEFIAYQYHVENRPDAPDLDADFDELAWLVAKETLSEESGQGFWWGKIVKRAMPTVGPERSADLLVEALTGSNFHIREISDQLLSQLAEAYPDVVLDALGKLILDEKNSWKFNVSRFSVFLSLPVDALARWLDKTSVQGALGIARHVPAPAVTSEGVPILHPLTELLLEKYGENEHVFAEFTAGVHSFQGYIGDIAGQKEQEAKNAEKFLNHRLPSVRRWAYIEIASAKREAEYFRAADDKFRD